MQVGASATLTIANLLVDITVAGTNDDIFTTGYLKLMRQGPRDVTEFSSHNKHPPPSLPNSTSRRALT